MVGPFVESARRLGPGNRRPSYCIRLNGVIAVSHGFSTATWLTERSTKIEHCGL
jgi:hypothetical protein